MNRKQKISETQAAIEGLKASIARIQEAAEAEGMVKDSSITLVLLDMMAQLAALAASQEAAIANQDAKIASLEKKVK